MAARGWGLSIVTAVGVAAGAGAAQLGLGYGLGIIAWLPASAADGEATWVASLAWATWIAATSVIAGAICGDRLVRSTGPESTVEPGPNPVAATLWRLSIAVAAAIGALITVALVAIPARSAVRADSFAPQTIAGGYTVIGVLAGLVVAFGALTSRAVAANLIATVGWLWLLAVVAVIHGVAIGRGLGTAQLGVWQFTTDGPWFRNLYIPGMLLSLIAALVIGAMAAWPAARRDDNRVGVAVSGAVGPLLVAAAYFLAAPRLVGVRAEQFSAYLLAPYAVIAGLAGSVLISALGSPTPAPALVVGTGQKTPPDEGRTAGPDTPPTPYIQPPDSVDETRGKPPQEPMPAGTTTPPKTPPFSRAAAVTDTKRNDEATEESRAGEVTPTATTAKTGEATAGDVADTPLWPDESGTGVARGRATPVTDGKRAKRRR